MKVVAWARGREFSRRCPHCGERIMHHRHIPIPLPWVPHPEVVRTFLCGTDQCLGHDKKGKMQRWTNQSEECRVYEIAFWRQRYTALRVAEKKLNNERLEGWYEILHILHWPNRPRVERHDADRLVFLV